MNKFTKSKLILQIVMASLVATFATIGIVAATTIGTNISTDGSLSVTGTTTLNSIAYVWPSNNGDSNQFLTTDGSGTLTWSTASPSSGGGWTDGGATVYPTSMSDRFLIGTTTVAGLSQLTVEATSTAAIPLTLRGYNGQTANLLQIQNVAGTNLFTINSSGAITAGAWNGTAIGSAYLDSAVILSTEINTLAKLNAILSTETIASTTWAGATSINTLGTITAGAWNGTAIGSAYIADAFLFNTGDTAAGNYNFDSGTLMIDSINHRIGIGTTTPANQLEIHAATGTTTVSFISQTASVGSKLILEDMDGAGCSEITVLDGVVTARIVACPAN